MKGRKETRDSTMLDASFKLRRGDVVAKAFKPRQISVPVKSTKSTVEVKDGISIEIPKGKKVGEMYHFNFAPEPDYMLQAPWVPMEKVYNFTSASMVLHIKVPARHTRVRLVPQSLMLEIPASTKPGSVVFFKHPDEAAYPHWFNTKLPSNWKGQSAQSRYLPVRLPKAEYEQRFGGNLQDLLQSLWEECRQLWRWLCCC